MQLLSHRSLSPSLHWLDLAMPAAINDARGESWCSGEAGKHTWDGGACVLRRIFLTREERVSAIRISFVCRSSRICLVCVLWKVVVGYSSLDSKRAPLIVWQNRDSSWTVIHYYILAVVLWAVSFQINSWFLGTSNHVNVYKVTRCCGPFRVPSFVILARLLRAYDQSWHRKEHTRLQLEPNPRKPPLNLVPAHHRPELRL